jgi:hypothetical protein
MGKIEGGVRGGTRGDTTSNSFRTASSKFSSTTNTLLLTMLLRKHKFLKRLERGSSETLRTGSDLKKHGTTVVVKCEGQRTWSRMQTMVEMWEAEVS